MGPYTPVVRAGGWLVASGQLGLSGGALVDGGTGAELAQAVANLSDLLVGEGASLADVVKTTVFLRDMADFPQVNEVYARILGDARPARSTVAVLGLPRGVAVEIEAVVKLPA